MAARTTRGLQARSAPAVRYLADLIANGYLGRPLSTTVSAHVGMWGANVPSAQHRYLITPDAGASLLTIPFGHAIDAVSFVLGEPRNIKATLATQRPVVYDIDSGADLQMMVADQVAVSALLGDPGVVASIHYRGGSQLSTPFRWEISGTEGQIMVEANSGNLQLATAVSILGARGEGTLVPLEVPAAYRLDPALEALKGTVAYNLGHAYARLSDDLRSGERTVPDFAHAARHNRGDPPRRR